MYARELDVISFHKLHIDDRDVITRYCLNTVYRIDGKRVPLHSTVTFID